MWVGFGVMILFFWFAGGFIFPLANSVIYGVTDTVWNALGVPLWP
jgi:hypothetical protein